MTFMRPRAGAAVVAAALSVTSLTGCGRLMSLGGQDCTKAPKEASDAIMAQARSDFLFGKGGARVERLQFKSAHTTRVPKDLQVRGADRLLGVRFTIRMSQKQDANNQDLAGSGIITDHWFLISSDNKVIGPMDDDANGLFTIQAPTDAQWAADRDRIYAPLQKKFAECVTRR